MKGGLIQLFVGFVLATALLGAPAAAPADITPGGPASDNVEWLGKVELTGLRQGGRLVGRYFYTNDYGRLLIFDVSDPEHPEPAGHYEIPQGVLEGEDLDTNGKILLLPQLSVTERVAGADSPVSYMVVLDVSKKAEDGRTIVPEEIGRLQGEGDHTISCILDCQWAYGSNGAIVDLRDPHNPVRRGKWTDGKPVRCYSEVICGHDVTEVSPGLVLTGTRPMMLLDARADPASPRLLATGEVMAGDVQTAEERDRFIHGTAWPSGGTDAIALAGGETLPRPQCEPASGAVMTWDASQARTATTELGRFRLLDEYRVANGTLLDGNPPLNTTRCSAHWFDAQPRFKGGGLVAATFYDHGMRFLGVAGDGSISELGYFLPWLGSTSAAYWITDEIVYTVDFTRGIDILRFKAPDVRPVDVSYSTQKVQGGRRATITATIRNDGKASAAAVPVRFSDSGTPIGDVKTIASVPAGGSASVSSDAFDLKQTTGEHAIEVVVDPDNELAEMDETNNTADGVLLVQGNKIKNGSFEESSDGSVPDSWSASGATTYAEGGTEGLRSVTAALGGSWTSAPVAVEAGEAYELSVDVAGAAGALVVEQLSATGTVLSTLSQPLDTVAPESFTSLETTVIAPAGVSHLRVVLLAAATGVTTFDDVWLSRR